MIEIENFLQRFDILEEFIKEAEFKDETNPVDGVVYPLICKDLPQQVINDIEFNLTFKVLSRKPRDMFCFMRRSPKSVPVPHKYHTDNSMGRYSMMVYLDNKEDAGTGFALHKETGAYTSQVPDVVIAKTIEDMNNDDKWEVYKKADMVKNKAVIFDASLFHVALPVGGYGKGKDSRTVLTCFFS